jgi:hypothetical protein
MYLTPALAILLLVASQEAAAGRTGGVGSVKKRYTPMTDELALLRLDQSLAPQYAYNASLVSSRAEWLERRATFALAADLWTDNPGTSTSTWTTRRAGEVPTVLQLPPPGLSVWQCWGV